MVCNNYFIIINNTGVGKTTLVKNICKKLQELNIAIEGFYTEEVRGSQARIGFDIVTLKGNSGQLARSM